MTYQRPKSEIQLSPEEKKNLLGEYLAFYEAQVQINIANLNKKVPRETFAAVMDEIGEILLRKSSEMAKDNEVIRKFLMETPLPPDLAQLLPDEFRVFCLLLNGFKQWVVAEQLATDRYLLGGTARDSLRKLADQCIVTGETIGSDGELHHPVRDGRPPILLSKKGHSLIEGQVAGKTLETDDDPVTVRIKKLRREGNHSWLQLREGCLSQLGLPLQSSPTRRQSSARSFAKKVHEDSGLSYEQILEWLDDHQIAGS
jgi:hypothetical protein